VLRRNHSRKAAALKICPQNMIFKIASSGTNVSRVIGHIISLEDKSENIHLDVIRRIFVSVKSGVVSLLSLVLVGGPRKGRNGINDGICGGCRGGGGIVGMGGEDIGGRGVEGALLLGLDKVTLCTLGIENILFCSPTISRYLDNKL